MTPYTYGDAHRNVLESEVFSEDQRGVLRKFDDWLQLSRSSISIATRYSYLMRLKTFVVTFWKHKPFSALRVEDVQQYLLHRPSTTASLDSATFKVFSTFLKREDLYKCFKSRRHNRNETEILSDEEVEAMKVACKTPYEKAVVSFLDDSGCRVGELRGLKVKDLVFDKHGAKVSVNGKTGPRTFRLVTSVPALQDFLNHHPKRGDREAWLFYGRNVENPVCAVSVRLMVKRIGLRAGLKKHVHPHMLRHTAATRLARYFTNRELEKRFGWKPGSKMSAVYTLKFEMEAVDAHYLEVMGKKQRVVEEKVSSRLILCVRCGSENDGTNEFCGKCGLILDREKALELEAKDDVLKRLERHLPLLLKLAKDHEKRLDKE